MKLPESNSRGEAILIAFLQKGPMTIYQGAEAHGEFPNRHLPNGINHAKMVELYTGLIEKRCLVKEGIAYRITDNARSALAKKMAAPPESTSIVPARVRNFFPKPLFVGCSRLFPWRVSL